MAQRPTPPRGMRDLLPRETAVRRALLSRILPVYERYGFEEIETPAVEEIGRLLGSEGGDNEKLIYKVLKRGLSFDEPVVDEGSIVDLGLRYDLTVPLARFYATHSNDLPSPFKAIQAGPVWRAERPQKGRYRQFMQCDIDVLGDSSMNSEIELVCATTEALRAVDVGAFTVRINHRVLLQSLIMSSGFEPASGPAVLVAVDKLDKIGLNGVESELRQIDEAAAKAMIETLAAFQDADDFESTIAAMPESVDAAALDDLRTVLSGVEAAIPDVPVVLDPTLVRGQGYYTGCIFEIRHDELSGSLAGGGRYDRMIGKLSGVDVPAVGFSIGFERLFDILRDRAPSAAGARRAVVLYSPASDAAQLAAALSALRKHGNFVRSEAAVKNRGAQLARLQEGGYSHWAEFVPGEQLALRPIAKEGSE